MTTAPQDKLKVILVTPLGVDAAIHPWGVALLDHAIRELRSNADVHIWNLYRDAELKRIVSKYEPLVNRLRPWIIGLARRSGARIAVPWMEDRSRWKVQFFYFASIVLALGPELLSLIRETYPLRAIPVVRRCRSTMQAFLREVEARIEGEVASILGGNGRAIVGISVYDGTVLNAMAVGRFLKTRFPGISLVLGGEALDPASAKEICSKATWLDGVVVGFGEDPLLSIIDAKASGISVRDLRLPGLFTPTHTPTAGSEYATRSSVESLRLGMAHRNENTGAIHVFARRGCGWGRCTFCREIFRGEKIDADPRATRERVAAILDALPPTEPGNQNVFVRFDNEDNDVGRLIDFLDFLEQESLRRDLTFEVFFWLTARQMARRENWRLFKSRPRIKVCCTIGIETFNPTTLRNMRKGVDVLWLLTCLKMVHDSGGQNPFNYFAYFPLEDSRSVREELGILARCVHLVAPTRSPVWLIHYQSSVGDAIYANQGKFQISVLVHNDIWLEKAFGVELPIGRAVGTSFSLLPSGKPDFSIVRTWHHAAYHQFGRILEVLGRLEQNPGFLKRLSLIAVGLCRGLGLASSVMKLAVKGLWLRDLTYLRRGFMYMKYLQFPKRSAEPELCLRGDSVTKANFPGGRAGNSVVTLEPLQVSMLRYLYEPRGRTSVIAAFQREHGGERVERVLRELVSLGMVLEWKTRMVSLVHDPEGLKTILENDTPAKETARAGSAEMPNEY